LKNSAKERNTIGLYLGFLIGLKYRKIANKITAISSKNNTKNQTFRSDKNGWLFL
jgi:hypothetical protein